MKSNGMARRGKQSKKEFDELLEDNYETGEEYYKNVEKKNKEMTNKNSQHS